ncbi:MAG TPA: DcaP family trimeric outer membrane transporter [Planctomycetota bacterium]|nr:DcaP family trimeric outer membrane transporter [Planctomycetota bacterium]
MKRTSMFLGPLAAVIAGAAALPAGAQEQDAGIKAWLQRVNLSLDQEKPPEPPPAPAQQPGQESPVTPRQNLNDHQEGAPRLDKLTLDPKYLGFIPIPNTPMMIKFNAKPRVDMTLDNGNAGDDNRFITAKIPVSNDPAQGGGSVFNINAKGSQLTLEVRAPELEGSPRFFYQNDFYGSGGGEFPYRIRHLYGEVHNVIVGMTFSVFEDPDVWPDTVDYEGPNSAIFARRPLARFMLALNPEWHLNFGIEQPESEIDNSVDPAGAAINHWPDIGANVRWEAKDTGHVQLATILRQLGYRGPVTGNQRTMGWGFNLSAVLNVFAADSAQAQVTVGEGIFRYMNDDFFNNDAAFDSSGDLQAIPCAAFMLGYTHRWNEEWRSTVSYGYVNLDNEASQGPDAYHLTHYTSANVVWQARKRLNLGFELLYGSKETNDGHTGNASRVMFGLVYSLF